MLRRLLPQGHVPEFTDPRGKVVIAEMPVSDRVGRPPAQRDRAGRRWAARLPHPARRGHAAQAGHRLPAGRPRPRRAGARGPRDGGARPRRRSPGALTPKGFSHARRHRRSRQRRAVHRPRAAAQRAPACCSSTRTPTASRRAEGPGRVVAAGRRLRDRGARGGRARRLRRRRRGDRGRQGQPRALAPRQDRVRRAAHRRPRQQPEERVDVRRGLGRRRRRVDAAPHDRPRRGGRERRRPRADLRVPAGQGDRWSR